MVLTEVKSWDKEYTREAESKGINVYESTNKTGRGGLVVLCDGNRVRVKLMDEIEGTAIKLKITFLNERKKGDRVQTMWMVAVYYNPSPDEEEKKKIRKENLKNRIFFLSFTFASRFFFPYLWFKLTSSAAIILSKIYFFLF